MRAWSNALNRGDDASAAALFAPGAEIVQGGAATRLETQAQARAWNAGLPCAGKIVGLSTTGEVVTATFLLATVAALATRVRMKWVRIRCRLSTPSAYGAFEPVTSMAPESPRYAGLLP